MTRARLVALLAPLLVPTGAALAQADSARADTAVVLPSLTVTATRRQPSRFAVPQATTTVRPGGWFGTRGYSLDEALAMVPGVLAQSRAGTSDIRLVIRGFGARGAGNRSNAGTTRGVRVLLDGFPETEPDGRTSFDGIDLAAAQSIEVIRSNASSTWGNAAGGVVSLSTLPEFDRGYARAETHLGGFGLERYTAQVGFRLGPGRLATTITRTVFDGWRVNSGSARWLANAALVTEVGPHTQLGVFIVATENRFEIPGPLTRAEVDQDPAQANPTYLARRERRHNRLGRVGTSLEHAFGAGGTVSAMLYVNPKFLQRSERGTFRDFTRYHLGGNLVYGNTFRLGDATRARVLAGFDEAYQDGAILFYSLSPEGNRGPELRDNKREGANNLGLFAQTELELGDRFGLSVGARYDAITYYADSYIDPDLSGSKAFTRVTPKLGLNYRASPTHSFYFSLGGGVEAPAGNETNPASTFGQDTVYAINPLLEPIRSTTYEVGSKQLLTFGASSALSDVSYDVALYRTNVTNEIVPYRGGRFYFTAGKVHRTGAELGVSLNTRKALFVQGMLTVSNNEYIEYLVDSVHYDPAKQGRFADFSGNEAVGVPSLMYGLTVGAAPRAWGGVRGQVSVQGSGGYFADDANTVEVPGYTLVNVAVGLDRPVEIGSGLTLRGTVGVTNLLDRDYLGSAFLNPDVVNGVPVAFEPGLPRSMTISFSLGYR